MMSKNEKTTEDTYLAIGMVIGLTLGAVLGLTIFDDLAIGAGIGLVFGITFGTAIDSNKALISTANGRHSGRWIMLESGPWNN